MVDAPTTTYISLHIMVDAPTTTYISLHIMVDILK
jgi:hypothetical protein